MSWDECVWEVLERLAKFSKDVIYPTLTSTNKNLIRKDKAVCVYVQELLVVNERI